LKKILAAGIINQTTPDKRKRTTLLIIVALLISTGGYSQQIHSYNCTNVESRPENKPSVKTTKTIIHGDTTIQIETIDAVADTNTNPDRVFITAGGASDILVFNTVSAAGQLNAVIKLNPKHSWNVTAGYNICGNIKNEKADSITIASIFFPDIGSSSFLLAMEYSPMGKGFKKAYPEWDFLITGEYTVQRRNVSIANGITNNDTTCSFALDNYNIGLMARWIHSSKDKKNNFMASLEISPYNTVEVIQNTGYAFNKIYAKDFSTTSQGMKLNYSGMSAVFSVEYNDALFYFRTFDVYPMLQGNFFFTLGIKATAKFFSF
jgi:hypothetical protein